MVILLISFFFPGCNCRFDRSSRCIKDLDASSSCGFGFIHDHKQLASHCPLQKNITSEAQNELNKEIELVKTYLIHKNIDYCQQKAYAKQVETLVPGDAVIVMDFKADIKLG